MFLDEERDIWAKDFDFSFKSHWKLFELRWSCSHGCENSGDLSSLAFYKNDVGPNVGNGIG